MMWQAYPGIVLALVSSRRKSKLNLGRQVSFPIMAYPLEMVCKRSLCRIFSWKPYLEILVCVIIA